MKITPEARPMKDIFSIEGNTLYEVPIFQRRYSWQLNNIEELFSDIINENEGYYIGNMLVTPRLKEEKTESFSIVDGQQRLTTVALFFLAIYECSLELEETEEFTGDMIKRNGSLQDDIRRKLLLKSNILNPKLQLLEQDHFIFLDLLRTLDSKDKGKHGNTAFGRRYNYILDLLRENLDNIDELFMFYNKLNEVEILRIMAENISDAFTVFSSINSKGMPLTLIDLMKSTYLGQAIKANVPERKAEDKWTQLVEIFSDKNNNQDSKIITQFLLNNYDTFVEKKGKSITKSKALKKYENVFEEFGGHKYIDELIYNAKIFSYISPSTLPDNEIEFPNEILKMLDSLKKLDSSQSYPLIMYILRKYKEGIEKFNKDNILKILDYLVKFYVRRNLAQKPKSSNIRSRILDTVRKIDNENIDDLLKEGLGAISVSDEEFNLSLMKGIYDIAPGTVRFVLISLERKFGREYFSKQNEDTLDKYMKTKRGKIVQRWTLEHILPVAKSLDNGWKEMIAPESPGIAEYIHQDIVHLIGNLTLTAYNPELSNKSFRDKVDFKLNESEGNYAGLRTPLYLNASIPDASRNETIESKQTWTKEDIERRTKLLAKEIIQEYSIQ